MKAASFSFRQTQMNTLLHSQPTQAVSSLHGVILPWNQRTLLSAPSREDKCCSPYGLQRREGGRERELCAFPASPSLQLCALARCKVILAVTCVDLKITRQKESGWSLFFSPPVYGTPFCLSWVLPLQTDEQQVRGDRKAFYLPTPEFRMCCFSCSS